MRAALALGLLTFVACTHLPPEPVAGPPTPPAAPSGPPTAERAAGPVSREGPTRAAFLAGRKTIAKCGVQKWAVKTLSDDQVGDVNFTDVQQVTVKQLARLTPLCKSVPETRSRPEEKKVFEVSGIIRVVKHEDDRDYHLALVDPEDANITLKTGNTRKNRDKSVVVEVIDPRCPGARDSVHVDAFKSTQEQFFEILGDGALSSLDGTPVKVRGVGLFDFDHGQTGMAKSCLELHPVLDMQLDMP